MVTDLNDTSWIPDDLYRQIINVMPIPCVDLIVEDSKGRILMLKRKNEPAKGQWWLPGGRIHFGEKRIEAARRKLKDECGLESNSLSEMGTFDIIYPHKIGQSFASHGISTVFIVEVMSNMIRADYKQSVGIKWDTNVYWLGLIADKNLRSILTIYAEKRYHI